MRRTLIALCTVLLAAGFGATARAQQPGSSPAGTAEVEIGGKTLAPGEYLLFIDLKPGNWTLIVSSLKAQQSYDPNNKTETWGSYGYDESKDVVRVPMTVGEIPFSLEQLTWGFSDVTDKGGTINIWWDKTTASVPFTLGS